MKKYIITMAWSMSIMACSTGTFATVVDSTQAGFTIRWEQSAHVSPMVLYSEFTKGISKWWDPDHTWSGKAENLSIQPVPGGCFCEKLGEEGSLRHMTVIYADPGKMFRMEGGLGPLQQFAVNGILTLEIRTVKDSSKVTLTYTVGGYIPGGVSKLAMVVDQVLGHQFSRFMDYAYRQAPRMAPDKAR
jgi:hypothetical protein